MLFDLRSGRRRRVIQVVFGALAVLFAVSFVGFGVGSEIGGGGFTEIFTGDGTDENPQEDDIKDAEKALEENPADTAALAELVTLHYQSSNQQVEIVDEETQETRLTSDGVESLQQGADAWNRLVKVSKGAPIDSSTAIIAVQLFSALANDSLNKAASESGQTALDAADDYLANYKSAAEAQKIAASDGKNSQQLGQVAVYFFLAGEYEAGDQAAQTALASVPPAQRAKIQKQLDAAEKQARQINDQIESFRKQLAKASAGAPGGGAAAGENPLGDLGGGGLSGGGLGGGLTSP